MDACGGRLLAGEEFGGPPETRTPDPLIKSPANNLAEAEKPQAFPMKSGGDQSVDLGMFGSVRHGFADRTRTVQCPSTGSSDQTTGLP